jgi:hypothetical protein
MAKCNRDVLEVLKSELRFLESGGYKYYLLRPWKPQLAFIESRTCQKNGIGGLQNCDGCVLMQFVSPEWRKEKAPCWHIPLNEIGQTVDSFYSWGKEENLEHALRTWLCTTILSIEDDRRNDSEEVISQ